MSVDEAASGHYRARLSEVGGPLENKFHPTVRMQHLHLPLRRAHHAVRKMGSIRRTKTKRMTRGLDQVKADLADPRHLKLHKSTKAAEDLPGLGEFYCIECAKWFEGEHNMAAHRRGKNHKRRLKELKAEAHTQVVADAAVGLGRQENKGRMEG